ncbi:response regulator transcription factor [Candidatus Epulonipiscium viviparus]|uniref:response regulator transcription factor n=1 Tax=Candidatus Epulonipiscium viviparus TaxID=420336 RepID=UPI002738092B|nr:response regulator transcription factor [Candidatus Epulopiscium viviparus]
MFKIMVAEDDTNTRKFMEAALRAAGYGVVAAADGEEALALMDTEFVDLIVLDIMMPKMDGYEFAETLRKCGVNIPILMVTAKCLPEDACKGFIAGTDDYMVKPINIDEMLLRIKALLRRAKIVSERKLKVGKLLLNYDAFSVQYENEPEQVLPQKEFLLLYKLLSSPDKIFTRLQLMDEIWGMETDSVDTTVNVHVNKLRKRFAAYNEFEIIAIRGIGYKGKVNDAQKN